MIEALRSESLIEQAARKLINKLHIVHADEKYRSVWIMAAIHDGFYTGPNYAAELQELELALGINAQEPRFTHPGALSKEKP